MVSRSKHGKLRYFDGTTWLDIPAPSDPASAEVRPQTSELNFKSSETNQENEKKKKIARFCLCKNPRYVNGYCVYCGDFVGETKEFEDTIVEPKSEFIREGKCLCKIPIVKSNGQCGKCRRKIDEEKIEISVRLDRVDSDKYGFIGAYSVCSTCGYTNKSTSEVSSDSCSKCGKVFSETAGNSEVVSTTNFEDDKTRLSGQSRKRKSGLIIFAVGALATILIYMLGQEDNSNIVDKNSRGYQMMYIFGQNVAKVSRSEDIASDQCSSARDTGLIRSLGRPQYLGIQATQIQSYLQTPEGFQGCLDGFDGE